jgi:hypothetical protein
VRARVATFLWVGLVVLIVGIVWDQRWHATHDVNSEFASLGAQTRAHWILWVGVVLSVVAAYLARNLVSEGWRNSCYLVVAGGLMYGVVSVWHSWEHARGHDPSIPHVLLVVALIVMFGGGVGTILTRKSATKEHSIA